MTTIATDGKTMAGDSRVTSGSQIVAEHTKVHKLSDGRIVGVCGCAVSGQRIIEYLDAGGKAEKPDIDSDVEALILNLDGTVDWIGKEFKPLRYMAPQAVGSGGDLAIGAMLAGASPEEAVAIAIQRDSHSGGPITVLPRTPLLKAV